LVSELIVVPEMVDSLRSKLAETLIGSFIKPREGLKYDVVIVSIMPNPELAEKMQSEIYDVKGVLVGSEEGGIVDYDSLSFIRKERIEQALKFRALINKELDVLGIELVE